MLSPSSRKAAVRRKLLGGNVRVFVAADVKLKPVLLGNDYEPHKNRFADLAWNGRYGASLRVNGKSF